MTANDTRENENQVSCKNGILVSCRVRLARNVHGLPFPSRMDKLKREELEERASQALLPLAGGNEFLPARLNNNNESYALVEQHLVSPDFTQGFVIFNKDKNVSVMVNEEDHFRIQVFGKDLNGCMTQARMLDRVLDERLHFAFDEDFGYLTACPTNLGTAMRASVMLHLPALTVSGAMRSLAQSHVGLAIRGLYGEGTASKWGYYQISNQFTLGVSEEEIVSRVTEATDVLVRQEVKQRQAQREKDPLAWDDAIYRAYGLLRHARRIGSGEAMEALATVRLGIDILGLDDKLLDRLIYQIQPYNLMVSSGRQLNEIGRDTLRAELLRSLFA